ncbi:MAG: hypothetical protein AAF988_08810, partial [Pseudomonadota bacterium]
KKIYLLFTLMLLLPLYPAIAQDHNGYSYLFEESPNNPQPRAAEIPLDTSGNVKDSFYFMKDDGEFSDKEKDSEAAYIYQRCLTSAFRRKYFDCACIAGAYRAERDKPDLIPQQRILDIVYNDPNTQCVNSMGIAGNSYDSCMLAASVFRTRKTEEENEKHCQCVANQTATNFGNNPKMNLRHIERISINANLYCGRRENRAIN